MKKIWILKSRYSYKLIKTEADLLRRIHKNSSFEVLEFELKSSSKSTDYLLSKERDLQLKSVLGELSEFEQDAGDLIKLYEELAPVGRISIHYNRDTNIRHEVNEKDSWISRLKKWQDNKVQFKKLITDEKDYFLNVIHDLRWMMALLKCHNFVDCSKWVWNKDLKKTVEVTDPKTLELFKLAKVELKKIKRKPKVK